MTIISQDGELINYANIIRITPFVGEIDKVEVYAILAFDLNSTFDDSITDGAIQLGIYNDLTECDKEINNIISALASDSKIYKMSEPELSAVV